VKPCSEACEQNKASILAVLREVFVTHQTILEIGSGTGQHAVYFGQQLPHLIWQTSDLPEHHPGIKLWLEDAGLANVLAPLALDVASEHWPIDHVDGVFSANAIHIMSWACVEKMFQGIGRVLAKDGSVCLYGPFNYDGHYTSASNARFDAWLKHQNPESGVRDFEEVDALARAQGLRLTRDYAMPANNRTLVWNKP
jgi:cyclopropane fatty-acyl-phospholipid synthase-like methyltransferase